MNILKDGRIYLGTFTVPFIVHPDTELFQVAKACDTLGIELHFQLEETIRTKIIKQFIQDRKENKPIRKRWPS